MEDSTLWDEAGRAIISHGPWAAAALIMFLALLSFLWWVLRGSAREVKDARGETANANERSMQLAKETVKVNTQVVERQNRLIDMMNAVLNLLQVAGRQGGSGRDDTPDPP